jgi:putative membrane protein
MKRMAIVALALSFSGAVLAQSVGEKAGVNTVLGVSPSTEDFVKEAAISDMFEIQSSELAAQRADAATKAFATQMIADHQKTSTELKAMVTAGTVKAMIPPAMDSAHIKMLDKLKGLQGAAFTKQYRSDQVSAHKHAVSLFQRYGKSGKDAPLKDWAAKTAPALEHHLQMAQDLEKKSS